MSQFEYSSSSGLRTVIIFGAVALSVIVFFALTLPIFKRHGAPEVPPAQAPVARSAAKEPLAPSVARPEPSAGAAASSEPARKTYLKPQNLLSDLVANLARGDVPAGLAILRDGGLDSDSLTRFERLLTGGRFAPASDVPFAEIGRLNSSVRYALNLTRPAGAGLETATIRVLLDLGRTESGAGWNVLDVQIPSFTAVSAVAAGLDGSSAAVVVPAAAPPPEDPLMLAHAFVEAVLERDFAKALTFVDPAKVTEEKLAGLLIVAEEGAFVRRDESPLVATAARDDAAWVIAQLVNPETGADFGLELSRSTGASGAWRVTGLNLDSLLLARSKMADVDDVTYTPIITDPQGGDSLVLFFGYDEDGLHPRALRQIEIVARILKNDPAKRIHINGHADAKGDDDYNSTLSTKRAANVKESLLRAGVAPAQIETRAFGESKPISPNIAPDGTDNPTGRKRNRRAEIYLNF